MIGVPAIRGRAAERAAVLVFEPIFESDLQPEQYAYRRDRNALDAVVFATLAILFGVFIIGCAAFKPSWLAATRETIHRKRKISPLTPTQPMENTDLVSDGSLWLSQPPQRDGACLVPYRKCAGAFAIGEFGGSRWRTRSAISI